MKRLSSSVFALAAAFLVTACGTSSETATAGKFDEWYQSFVKDRHYSTCTQEIARLDPSHDEKADWDAGKRQFYVEIWKDPRIMTDTAVGPYVPGLENCVISANYAADRDVGRLEDVSTPLTPAVQACSKAAFAYVASYNSLRAKRHPTAEKEFCSAR